MERDSVAAVVADIFKFGQRHTRKKGPKPRESCTRDKHELVERVESQVSGRDCVGEGKKWAARASMSPEGWQRQKAVRRGAVSRATQARQSRPIDWLSSPTPTPAGDDATHQRTSNHGSADSVGRRLQSWHSGGGIPIKPSWPIVFHRHHILVHCFVCLSWPLLSR